MKTNFDKIEELINIKVNLFKRLIEILKLEKVSIVDIDVNELTKFSNQKNTLSSEIETTRKKILSLLESEDIEHKMDKDSFQILKVINFFPENKRLKLEKIYYDLISIKKEIRKRTSENKFFIEEFLNTVEDVIGILINSDSKTSVYDRGKNISKGNYSNNLLSREA